MSEHGLFDGVLARGGVGAATDDRAWLQALLDAEAALAQALADVGRIPKADAAAIAERCGADGFDIAALGRDAADGGNPVIPLVAALRAAVGPPADRHVHTGATSQDIVDTASMLIAGRALDVIISDLSAAVDRTAALAREHRDSPMMGRTLLQHAVATTFGLVAATWLLGLDAAVASLLSVRASGLAAQLGGPAGTLDAFGPDGSAVVQRFAARLGLAAPVAPWHTERSRVTTLAGALGTASAAMGGVALDIVLLGQSDVGEVAELEPGAGGSSSMPHKQNPIAAVSARAAAIEVPGLVATLLTAASAHELQRAAGAWHAEWRPLRTLLVATGSAASWLRDSLGRLQVDTARMRQRVSPGAEVATAAAVVDRILSQRAGLSGSHAFGQSG